MKKAISLLLTLMLALSLCAVSLADDPDEIPGTAEMPYAGLRFVPPEQYRNTTGVLVTDGSMELEKGTNYAYWVYCAMTEEEVAALYNGTSTMENPPMVILFYVFSIGGGKTFDDMNASIGGVLSGEYAREIAKVGDYTFYLYMEGPDQNFIDSIDPAYQDEYARVASAVDDVAAAFTCYEPLEAPDPYADLVGSKFEFSAVDLDGNAVSSADLFAQHEITMVNIWATWCGPCIGELAELQQISLRLQEKDCAVIGMLLDDDLDECRSLLAENGVTYPIIQAPTNLDDLVLVEYVPTTVFIGRDGTVLASPVIGAQVDAYESTVDSLLQK